MWWLPFAKPRTHVIVTNETSTPAKVAVYDKGDVYLCHPVGAFQLSPWQSLRVVLAKPGRSSIIVFEQESSDVSKPPTSMYCRVPAGKQLVIKTDRKFDVRSGRSPGTAMKLTGLDCNAITDSTTDTTTRP